MSMDQLGPEPMPYVWAKFFWFIARPMKPEEEREALEAYHAGDQQAKNKLIERNLRLVAHIAKKYEGGNRSTEDMISIGTIGLIKAVNTYDGSKGTQLATYAARCIENAMRS